MPLICFMCFFFFFDSRRLLSVGRLAEDLEDTSPLASAVRSIRTRTSRARLEQTYGLTALYRDEKKCRSAGIFPRLGVVLDPKFGPGPLRNSLHSVRTVTSTKCRRYRQLDAHITKTACGSLTVGAKLLPCLVPLSAASTLFVLAAGGRLGKLCHQGRLSSPDSR